VSNDERSWTAKELNEALDVYESELRDSGLRRNTINTYVQHPERFIRWLEGRYSPEGPRVEGRRGAAINTKYDPLYYHLSDSPLSELKMTFVEIERVLGFALPASARRYQAWWANADNSTASHAKSWLRASFKTRGVDLNSQVVTFVKGQLP
jgi:hypothetical protein